ncbi:MAG: binding-protein-dependent transport system inner rane component [Devosia sp.]|nr:binding-protein-dependent transport system inner rane component [Devosia sp.]
MADAGGIVRSRTLGSRALTVLKYTLLTIGAIVMVAPFLDMFFGALRTVPERLARPPVYFPQTPQWDNFAQVFREMPMLQWGINSLITTLSVTVLQVTSSAMAGYALAKFEFFGRMTAFRFVLGAQMFPFFLFIIPMFFILRYFPLVGGNDIFGKGGMGLLNSYLAIILPFAVSWHGVFLMRQFMMAVPSELLDAARMDGAGEFRIFFTIVLPLVTPGLATLAIFVFVYQWNEVIWTMTVTRTAPNLQTVPVGIYLLRGAYVEEAKMSVQQAAIFLSILPVMIAFLFLQRFYVRGLTAGGVKG